MPDSCSSAISQNSSASGMATCSSNANGSSIIKVEDVPDVQMRDIASSPLAEKTVADTPSTVTVDPRDPEGLLRTCTGYNKKTKARCSQVIGKNSYEAKIAHAQSTRPKFLPTCKNHRDQQDFAGWCQFMQTDTERCGRLFRWTPPYLELCPKHQDRPDTPCYFLKLPIELRQEIFSYLLPTEPITSSASHLQREEPGLLPPRPPSICHRRRRTGPMPAPPPDPRNLPFPLLDLFLISRQIYAEAKDLLYATVPFVIDIRKDGTFMCGRRLLEPRRADGSCVFYIDNEQEIKERFIRNFDFGAVKNYIVDIVVEDWSDARPVRPSSFPQYNGWDEEVEIYDIRDYISVAVSGILGQSRNLCKLNVRVGLCRFKWDENETLANVKCLIAPFERLRNVRQPRLCGIFDCTTLCTISDLMPTIGITRIGHHHRLNVPSKPAVPLCSVYPLRTHTTLLGPGNPGFDAYKKEWERLLSQISTTSLSRKTPIRAMFTEFKKFYTTLSDIMPGVVKRQGPHAFLHRARVAREKEDVEGFRHLRNELIELWNAYLVEEEAKREVVFATLSRMLDMDTYPSHEPEPVSRRGSSRSDPGSSSVLDAENVADGISTQFHESGDAPRKYVPCASIIAAAEQAHAATALRVFQTQRDLLFNDLHNSSTDIAQAQNSASLDPVPSPWNPNSAFTSAVSSSDPPSDVWPFGPTLTAGYSDAMPTTNTEPNTWSAVPPSSSSSTSSNSKSPWTSTSAETLPSSFLAEQDFAHTNTADVAYTGHNFSAEPVLYGSAETQTRFVNPKRGYDHDASHDYSASGPPAKKQRLDSVMDGLIEQEVSVEDTMGEAELPQVMERECPPIEKETNRDMFMGRCWRDAYPLYEGKGKQKVDQPQREVVWID